MTATIVSLKGDPLPSQPNEPDPGCIAAAESLLAAAKSGEIVGIQAQLLHANRLTSPIHTGFMTKRLLGEMHLQIARVAKELSE
jgi:hypothetical protein